MESSLQKVTLRQIAGDASFDAKAVKKKPQHEKNNLRDAFSTLTRQNFA
jgi:hypothetical protein